MPKYTRQFNKALTNRHSEFTHIWGLAGFVSLYLNNAGATKTLTKCDNTGWYSKDSFASYTPRINRMRPYLCSLPNPPHLNLRLIDINDASFEEYMECLYNLKTLKLHEMMTVALTTQTHHSTVNIIKAPIGYEVVYVNRGSKDYMDNRDNVQIYCFENTIAIAKLLEAARYVSVKRNADEQKKVLARVFNLPEWKKSFDKNASCILSKGFQKVGNCTVSNSNMAWHLMLALKQVKAGAANDYVEGYQQTIEQYRTMRLFDRALALESFINNKQDYSSDSYHAIVITIIIKSQLKGNKFSHDLITALGKINPDTLSTLSKDIQYIIDRKLYKKCIQKGSEFDSVYLGTLCDKILEKPQMFNESLNMITTFKQQLDKESAKLLLPKLTFNSSAHSKHVNTSYTRLYRHTRPTPHPNSNYQTTYSSSYAAPKLPNLR